MASSSSLFLVLILLATVCVVAEARALDTEVLDVSATAEEEARGNWPLPRPPHTQYAEMARYLVHMNQWGVISTQSNSTGEPWGNVVDVSDGAKCSSTGRLFFYLTEMDETVRDAHAHPEVAFTLAEAAIAPKDPTCAKLIVTGQLLPVEKEEEDVAKKSLFSRHPQMRLWPTNHGFAPYELHLRTIGLLDFYGGMKQITTTDYFNVKVDCGQRGGGGGGGL